jgi:hypothetical protein
VLEVKLQIRHSSRKLFVFAALLIAIAVFAGFSRTYYLHRWFRQPALSTFLHVHAIVMTSWIALFLIQTLLISGRRIALHRRLGFVGMISATLVPVFGILATVIAARREVLVHAQDVRIVIIVLALELIQMLMFAGFVTAGFLLRDRADYHKRLMLLATFCMLPNAIVRIVRMQSFIIPLIIWTVSIAVVVFVDCLVQRKVHRVFARYAVFEVVMLWLAFFAGSSETWQQFAAWAVS